MGEGYFLVYKLFTESFRQTQETLCSTRVRHLYLRGQISAFEALSLARSAIKMKETQRELFTSRAGRISALILDKLRNICFVKTNGSHIRL